MEPQEPPPNSSVEPPETTESEPVWVPGYPWWVRGLAVLHVLSLVLAPAAFFLFAIAAGVLVLRRGRIDEDVIALAGIGIACPAVGIIYRGWFERWGRRNYPETLVEEKSRQEDD